MVVYSSMEDAMYEAEILSFCPLKYICLCMVSYFAEVKMFSFWPKTMDYSKVFWQKLKSFFV